MPTDYPTLATLLSAIDNTIYTNTHGDVTGDIMQGMLKDQSSSIWTFIDKSVNSGNTNTDWLKPYASKTGFGTYYLDQVYGLSSANGSMLLSQLYTQPVAADKFATIFHWYVAAGHDTADIMNMRHGTACYMTALLNGYSGDTWGSGRIGSNNAIIWPSGVFHHNYSMVFDVGQYIGRGTTAIYVGVAGATVHVLDRANWMEDPSFCPVMKDSLGDGPWSGLGYMEGLGITQMRFAGLCDDKAHDPSYYSCGISMRSAGEGAVIGNIKTNGFNGDGLRLWGGTPTQVDYISSFSNTLGAIGIYGGALNTYNFGMISCDDNTCIFHVRDYNGDRSGGIINAGFIKAETDARKVGNDAGVPTYFRGQIICDADGFTGPNANEGSNINLVIGNYTYACAFSRTHSMFAIRGFAEGRAVDDYSVGRNARVKVNGTMPFNTDFFVQDIGSQQQWPKSADYAFSGFTWNAITGILSMEAADGTPAASQVQTATQRLGVMTTEPSWDTVPPFDPTFGGTITPDPSTWQVEDVAVAVLPSEIHMGDTAQCYGQAIDDSYRLRGNAVTWSVVSGPATVDSTTGIVTPTGTGIVVLLAGVSGAWHSNTVTLHVIA